MRLRSYVAGPGIFPELFSTSSKKVFLVDFGKLPIAEGEIPKKVLYSPGPGIELRSVFGKTFWSKLRFSRLKVL
jgi:hypothetical protein